MIVLDSSTLILIAKIEVLNCFLESITFQVRIPTEVAKESCAVKKSLDAQFIQKAIDEAKISVIAVKDRKLLAKLRSDFGLGIGEAEAIVLALLERVALIGIDDKNGINSCELLGIPFTTAIGILIRMHEKKLLTKEKALARLTTLGEQGRYKQSILEHAKHSLETGI